MTITHRLVGSGEHGVLVLHDWFGTSAGWGPFPEYLDGSAFSYAFLDYRGYGERAAVEGEYSLAEIAGDALALADQLGWETFSLVGHSMGGKAAQQVLARAPERVRKLAGVAPVAASAYELGEAYDLFHGAAAEPGNRRAIIDLVTGNRATGVWLDRMVANSLGASRPEAFASYLEQWTTVDLSAEVSGLRLPARAFVGEHDLALNEDYYRSTWLTHYPEGDLELLPASGHYPMQETPVAFATTLERFLGE
ncbi:alpha/beta hydrolase [Kitasatospora albolonga]|uniref:alpha/beta fold hydrolase n=1 Tax=Kitasatospora albolonga TaxID=68173 RepID=UPI0031ED53D2